MRSTTQFQHLGAEKCACGKPASVKISFPSFPARYRCVECDARFNLELKWERMGGREHEDTIICPFCGKEFMDSWEIEDDQEEFECDFCGRRFDIDVHHSVTYSTWRSLCEMPDDWNGEDRK